MRSHAVGSKGKKLHAPIHEEESAPERTEDTESLKNIITLRVTGPSRLSGCADVQADMVLISVRVTHYNLPSIAGRVLLNFP